MIAILLSVLLHGLMAFNFDLSTDEAHYALYGFFPALSYFDHPPLVGWAQIPFMYLFAGQPPDWALRIVPVVCHALTLVILTRFANSHFGERAARWTAIIIAVSPLPHVLGAAQVPDTLLMLWAAALLVLTDQLCRTERPRMGRWMLLGLVLGLAGLSKYTAVFFVPAILLALLLAHGFSVLLRPGPWLAALIAALLISPIIIWNAQHDWISFVYQGAHGAGNQTWQAHRVAQQTVLQILVYGPLLTLWPLVLLKKRHEQVEASTRNLILLFALPFIALMLFLAGRSNALPHWTAPAWLLLAPLAGLAVSKLNGKFSAIVAGSQALLCVLLVGWMLSGGTPDPDGLKNPPADLYGWRAAGERGHALATDHQAHRLAVQNWSIASRLAWYGRPSPLHVLDTRFDQFDLWSGDLPLGADAILIDWSSLAFELPVGQGQFTQCTHLEKQPVLRWGQTLAYFNFYHCQHWGGQAAPKERKKH